MPHIVVFEKSPHPNVKDQVLDMVQNYLTELSMTAIPPSNYLHAFYKWLLAAEVDQYIYLMGKRDDFPVELVVAFEDSTQEKILGFLLYLPVRSVSDACGVSYMAVEASHRRTGIGKAMMAEMIARYPHVELTCTVEKVPFYESRGFQVLDVHNTHVVMNTRNHSTTGTLGIVDADKIAKTPEAKKVLDQLVQHRGLKAMVDAEKKLLRHLDQLTRKAEMFVRERLATNI